MKIVSASVDAGSGRGNFTGSVVIMSDGVRVEGVGHGETPIEAIHTALSKAARVLTDELRDSLQVSMAVSF